MIPLARLQEKLVPQPLIAILGVTLALAMLTTSQLTQQVGFGLPAVSALVPVILFGGVILAEQFPIHVRVNTKVQMTTIFFFLMAVLLPPPMAGLLAGLAMVAGEVSVNKHKGNYPSDIATDAARWAVAVFVGSQIVHLHTGLPLPVILILAAATMFWWDMISSPATLSPMSGERPLRVIIDMVREAGPAEAAQYVIGVMATVLIGHALWAAPLLLLPAGTVYISTKRSKELHQGTRAMLEGMADTVDLRDPYTGGHSRRVTEFVTRILQAMEKTGPEVELIVTAARLHDIGKIAVPDAVLNKPGKLTEEEWQIMASHAEVGADFLGKHPGFRRGIDIVRHHHEAWDGSGYPHRLRGTDIPLGSRIIAVADSYDAMTSDRPYRAGMSRAKAVSILREGRGVQWDAQIVDAFVRSLEAQVASEPALRLVHSDGKTLAAIA